MDFLLEDRHGAGDENTGSNFASIREEDYLVASGGDRRNHRSADVSLAPGALRKNSAMTGYSTGGEGSPAPNGCL